MVSALKQRNLENADNYLMRVSHPSSPEYGKLWTSDDVREAFSPSEESIDAVKEWLADAGIEDVQEKKGWVVFESSIASVEDLIRTEYHEHEDVQSGAIRLGCDM